MPKLCEVSKRIWTACNRCVRREVDEHLTLTLTLTKRQAARGGKRIQEGSNGELRQ